MIIIKLTIKNGLFCWSYKFYPESNKGFSKHFKFIRAGCKNYNKKEVKR